MSKIGQDVPTIISYSRLWTKSTLHFFPIVISSYKLDRGPLDKTEHFQQLCHPDNLLELIPDEKVTKRFCEY